MKPIRVHISPLEALKIGWIGVALWTCPHMALGSTPTSSVKAIRADTGKAIAVDTLINNPESTSIEFIDERNQRVELGPRSSASFAENGDFQLLRGSAILSSKETRETTTANAKITYQGKLIISYDYRERASSGFVLLGSATIQNAETGEGGVALTQNQGASLLSGSFYPSLLRNLDFTQVNSWLERYGWSEKHRQEIAEIVPSAEKRNRLQAMEAGGKQSFAKSHFGRELASYFPIVEDSSPKPAGKYERNFNSSELRGQAHTSIEAAIHNNEEIEILTPEQAAVIVLPDLGLGPGVKLEVEREDRRRQQRLPASLKKVKTFTASTGPSPAQPSQTQANTSHSEAEQPVQKVLSRLQEMETEIAPAARPSSALDFLDQNF